MGAFMKAFSEANYNYLEDVFGSGERDYLGCLLRKGQLPQLGSETRVAGACPPPPFVFTADIDVPDAVTPPRSVIPPPPVLPPDPIIPPLSDIPPPPKVPPPANIPPPGSDASSGQGLAEGRSGAGAGGNSGIRSGGGQQNLIPTGGGSSKAFGNQQLSNQRNNSRGKGRIILLSKSEEDDSGSPLASGSSSAGDSSRNISSNIQGSRVVQLSKKAKGNLASQTKDSTTDRGATSSFRKKVIPLVEKKAFASIQDEGLSWDFGDIIKYLVIIAVILLILLLIGGQFLQIKKGLEGSR